MPFYHVQLGKTHNDIVHEFVSLIVQPPADLCLQACVKYNFVGIENPRLYSETYLGTKHLLQGFVDQLNAALNYLLRQSPLSNRSKGSLCSHLNANFGRTALCLSGGTLGLINQIG